MSAVDPNASRVEYSRPCAFCGRAVAPTEARQGTITVSVGTSVLAFAVHPECLLRAATDATAANIETFYLSH